VLAAFRGRRIRLIAGNCGLPELARPRTGPPSLAGRPWPFSFCKRLLDRDLAGLSANGGHEVSKSRDHYLMAGDPGLVTAAIRDVVRGARSGARLADVAAVEAGPEAG
jgi:hypothetical protein